jgi:predicted regulator of amino acid metabolism with ACT domain
MWQAIRDHFRDYPAQEKVARLFLETGLCVRKGKIYCNDIEVPPLRVARVAGVDRRAVVSTVSTIMKSKDMSGVFGNLRATAFFKDVAPAIGAGLIVIIPTDAGESGIMSGVAKVISDLGISVRQSIAEDPEFSENAKLFIITAKPVPMKAMEKIKSVKGVKSVIIY